MAVASPSVSGLVAMMISRISPWATRSRRDLMYRSSGPTPFMGDRTPWRTWYFPRYSRARSRAMTSLGSATTQTTPPSRFSLAQMAQGPSPSVRFWHTGHREMLFLASRMEEAKVSTSSSGRERVKKASRWAVLWPMPGSRANCSTSFSRAGGKYSITHPAWRR